MTEDATVSLKFVLLGQEGVGKTTIIRKFCLNEQCKSEYNPTIGMDIYTKTIILGKILDIIVDDINVNLNIYDVNGKVCDSRNLPNLLSNSDALIFVYDVNHVGSFESLKNWIKAAQDCAYSSLMVLVGHKIDLLRNISIDDQIIASKDYQLVFNTEASSSELINTAFVRIASEILTKQEDSIVIFKIINIRWLYLKFHKIRE